LNSSRGEGGGSRFRTFLDEFKGRRRVKTSSVKIFLGESRGGGGPKIKIVWIRPGEIKYNTEFVQGGRWRVKISECSWTNSRGAGGSRHQASR